MMRNSQFICAMAVDSNTFDHSERVFEIAVLGCSKEGTDNAEFCSRLMDVAYLHDVVEDSSWTLDDLERLGGFGEEVIDAVDLLTRKPPYDYSAYIDRICDSDNEIAIRVKLADIEDHLTWGDCGEGLRKRYEKAKGKLEEVLRNRQIGS